MVKDRWLGDNVLYTMVSTQDWYGEGSVSLSISKRIPVSLPPAKGFEIFQPSPTSYITSYMYIRMFLY